MTRYWLRILGGALLVFAVGMLVLRMVRRTATVVADAVTESMDTSAELQVPVPLLPFRVDGAEVGTLRRVDLQRTRPFQVTSVRVLARIEPGALPADCRLVAERLDRLGETAFRCATGADTAGQDLVAFGEVEAVGAGETWPLLVPRETADRFGRYGTGPATGYLPAEPPADGPPPGDPDHPSEPGPAPHPDPAPAAHPELPGAPAPPEPR